MNHRVVNALRIAMFGLLACTALHEANAAAPTVTTNAASGITDSSATLNGTVNDNGKTTTATFEAGFSTSYGSTFAATTGGTVGAGAGNTAVAVTLTALDCNTTIHYRAKGVNADGTTFGGDQSFTTAACTSGVCGADNGLTFTVTPTNLCAAGIASSVSAGATSYNWTCAGGFGWNSATCSATREYAVTSSVGSSSTGTGTVAASKQVAYSATPSFTLTPAAGYYSAPVTGTCGGTLTGNTFVTNPITASCTVVANFAPIALRHAFFINASGSANKTSVVRVINLSDLSSALTATAYDEAGNVVGAAGGSLGSIAAQQMLTFTSAQFESALGYAPSSGTAKYRIVFSANLPNFDVIDFTKDVAVGNLTLAQPQSGSRAAATASSSVRNMLVTMPSTNPSRTSVVRLINTTGQSGTLTATAYNESGSVVGMANAAVGVLGPQQMLTFTSAQLESAIGYVPSSATARYFIAFNSNLTNLELINFVKETASGNVTLAQAQVDDRSTATEVTTVRNALLVNASSNTASTSLVRLINLDWISRPITATAYNEAGRIVGRADTALGSLGGLGILTFSSAQLESAIGYAPESASAKYRIVFKSSSRPTFELVNFLVDGVSGILTLGQAQVDNRTAGTATTSVRNALFVNASTSANKTSIVRLINLADQSGTVTATAYNESGSMVGVANATVGVLGPQQMLSFTSAQLESSLGFVPLAPTAKYRVVFNANLPSFEVVNFVVDIATGGVTLGQIQVD